MLRQRALHDGVKQHCSQCKYQGATNKSQATRKGCLALHQSSALEVVKYACRQHNCEAMTKSHLAQHQMTVHEGVKKTVGETNN